MHSNYKEQLKYIAKETLDIIDRGFYQNRNRAKIGIKAMADRAISGTELVWNKDIKGQEASMGNSGQSGKVNISVIKGSTIDTIIDLRMKGEEGNIIALNFASAKHAGGGFLKGAVAQEESIARASTIYPCLMSKKEFYEYNVDLKTPLYSDAMIYSPDVPIIRNDKGELLIKPMVSSFITSPAVNAKVAYEKGIKGKIIEETMKNRIRLILDLAISKKPSVILLGAYGCGVFGNKPEEVAKMFKEAIESKSQLIDRDMTRIIFAIYDKEDKMLDTFKKELGR